MDLPSPGSSLLSHRAACYVQPTARLPPRPAEPHIGLRSAKQGSSLSYSFGRSGLRDTTLLSPGTLLPPDNLTVSSTKLATRYKASQGLESTLAAVLAVSNDNSVYFLEPGANQSANALAFGVPNPVTSSQPALTFKW